MKVLTWKIKNSEDFVELFIHNNLSYVCGSVKRIGRISEMLHERCIRHTVDEISVGFNTVPEVIILNITRFQDTVRVQHIIDEFGQQCEKPVLAQGRHYET